MKLQAPEGSSGVTHAGVDYDVDEDGCVDVPEDAVQELKHHGFTEPAPKVKRGRKNEDGAA